MLGMRLYTNFTNREKKNKWIQWENQELFLERVEYILGRWRTPTREAELDWPPGNCSDLSPLATQQVQEKVILSQEGVILFLLISMEKEEKRGTSLTELTLRDLLRIGMKLFYLKRERWEGIPWQSSGSPGFHCREHGFYPSQRTKIAHATCHGKKKKEKWLQPSLWPKVQALQLSCLWNYFNINCEH